MGWFSSIMSVLPTVGGIVGQLIGATSVGNGVVSYRLRAKDGSNDEGCEAIFFREKEHYKVYNSSHLDSDTISLSLSTKNGAPAENLLIPGTCKFPLDGMFKNAAKEDSTGLEVSAGVAVKTGANSNAVKLTASALGIPVGDKKEHQVGSFLLVSLDVDKMTISAPGYVINDIPSVLLQAEGDMRIKMFDITGTAGEPITIGLPSKLIDGDVVAIDIAVHIASLNASQKLWDKSKFEKADKTFLDELRNAPRLNW
jgi:hypothetical protein